jgi:hypothetical protein
MQRNRRPSAQAVNILRALAADPARWCYGYDLAGEVYVAALPAARADRAVPRALPSE